MEQLLALLGCETTATSIIFRGRALSSLRYCQTALGVASLERRERGHAGAFTVNSSNNAIAVYERLGFRRTAPVQDSGGVLFNADGVTSRCLTRRSSGPRSAWLRHRRLGRLTWSVRQLSNSQTDVHIRQSEGSKARLGKRAGRVAFMATFALLAGGCATSTTRAPLAAHVTLAGLSPSADQIPIVDLRPSEARANRTIEANGTYVYLADEAVEPSPVALLSSTIAKALPDAFQRSTIELLRLDLGFWTTEKVTLQSNTPIYIIQGAPVGANVLGNLLGQAVVAAIRAAVPVGVTDAAVANVEFRVGTSSVKSIEVVVIQGPITPTQALESAVSRALKNISGKVDAMKYWDPKQAAR